MPKDLNLPGDDGVDDFLKHLFDEADAQEAQARELDRLRRAGAIRVSETTDVRVERIVNPYGGGAEEVAGRHEALNMADRIALAAHLAMKGDQSMLAGLRSTLPMTGAFLERDGYAVDDIRGKIARPDEYVLVHSGGVITDNSTLIKRPFAWVSDMALHMAPDDPKAPMIAHVPHPDEVDQFHPAHQEAARAIARQIHENHARVGVVTDVSVYPVEYRDHRFASRARRHVSRVVREQVNPTRRNSVDIWLASMFRIEGIRRADGTRIDLPEPIINTVSVMRHTMSSHFGAFLGWRVPASDIPVTITTEDEGSQEFYIETGWETAVLQPKHNTDY